MTLSGSLPEPLQAPVVEALGAAFADGKPVTDESMVDGLLAGYMRR